MSKPKWKILQELSPMVRQYLETALWSSSTCDEQGNDTGNLDDDFGVEDFTKEALQQAIKDCEGFVVVAEGLGIDFSPFDMSTIGHDFWLTRNGHGAGFWDGDYPKEIGQTLTNCSKMWGSCNADGYRGFVHLN